MRTVGPSPPPVRLIAALFRRVRSVISALVHDGANLGHDLVQSLFGLLLAGHDLTQGHPKTGALSSFHSLMIGRQSGSA